MERMNRATVLPALMVALLMASLPSWAQSNAAIQLSLKREYGRAQFSECRLDVTILEGKGRSALSCSRTPAPDVPGNVSQNRALTASEVADILKLAQASDLFAGGHIGNDSTSVDGLFETLKVTQSGRTAVLVSSGNDSFESGGRRGLIRLLRSMLNDLQKAATQE
jgi:hypothetical protein